MQFSTIGETMLANMETRILNIDADKLKNLAVGKHLNLGFPAQGL
jgi:hypothetical protein